MITQRQFRAFKAKYHRNGVAGEGFFLCSWYDLEAKSDLNAIVFREDAQTAVFDASDYGRRFRGDYYATALRKAIKAVEAAQPESLHT